MGLTSQILLNIPREGKHLTGRPVKGIVKYNIDKETVYKKISLSLVGKGYCSWYIHRDVLHHHHNNVQKVHEASLLHPHKQHRCEGQETIVVQKIYLLNKETDDNVTLRAGSYEQPFEIFLPLNIPPTMKTDIGEIKYNLILKFKKPGIFSINKQFKTRIDIYPSVDPSGPDGPIIVTLDKTLTKVFSTKKHEINLKAELDKGYLTPSGESKISFHLTNNSDVTVSLITELVSKTKYKDDHSYEKKTVEKVINDCTVMTPSVPDNSVANMFNIIPVNWDLCTVRYSTIIQREYKLKVTLNLPLPHFNASIEIPVFIGDRFSDETEPLDDFNENIVVHGTQGEMGKPPSYWEAMSEDTSKD